MKHYTAHLESTCVVCLHPIRVGMMVVKLEGSECNKLNIQPQWRNHWIHKSCYKLIREVSK